MKKRSFGIALGLISLLAACGGGSDSTKSNASTAAGSSANSGKFTCGKDTCVLPDALKGEELCCMDAFAGGCGIKSNASCRAFPSVDDRCPVPDVVKQGEMGAVAVTAYGCCTTGNACGLDFGMGCMDVTFLCQFISTADAASLNPTTCDGSPIALPANCGSQGRVALPGLAGSGG